VDSKSARNAPEPRCCPGKRNVSRGFALEHLSNENQLTAFVAIPDAVADHAFAEYGGELWSKVTHLIGVWKQNEIGLGGFDDLL